MDRRTKELVERLKDERSRKVVFVSHCILNENTRYLGGAFRKGCVDEIVLALQKKNVGIVQMRCPEQKAWGGVLKRYGLFAYGCKGSFPLAYALRTPLISLFIWYTKLEYRRLAREVASEIKDYADSGFEVVGIVGVGGSPSCGVSERMDFKKTFEFIASRSIGDLDREEMNAHMYGSCLSNGNGFFVEALERELQKRNLKINFLEHSLASEYRGGKTRLAF